MLKSLAAIATALATWLLVATLGNRLLRVGLVGYAEVEATMNFTLTMQFARLALGAIASLAAGAVAGWIAGRHRSSVDTAGTHSTRRFVPAIVAALLFIFFVPAHIALWTRFPVWYHASFLASLLLLPTLAGRWAMQLGRTTARSRA